MPDLYRALASQQSLDGHAELAGLRRNLPQDVSPVHVALPGELRSCDFFETPTVILTTAPEVDRQESGQVFALAAAGAASHLA